MNFNQIQIWNNFQVFFYLIICVFTSHSVFAQNEFAKVIPITHFQTSFAGDKAVSVIEINNEYWMIGNIFKPGISSQSYFLRLNKSGDTIQTHPFNGNAFKIISLNGKVIIFNLLASDSVNILQCLILNESGNFIQTIYPNISLAHVNEQITAIYCEANSIYIASGFSELDGYSSILYQSDSNFIQWKTIPLNNYQKNSRILSIFKISKDEIALCGNRFNSRYTQRPLYLRYNISTEKVFSIETDTLFSANTWVSAHALSNKRIRFCGTHPYVIHASSGTKAFSLEMDTIGNISNIHTYNPLDGLYEDLSGIIAVNNGESCLFGNVAEWVHTNINELSVKKAAIYKLDSYGKINWTASFDFDYAYALNANGWYDGTVQSFSDMIQTSDSAYLAIGAKEFPISSTYTEIGTHSIIVKTSKVGSVGNHHATNITETSKKHLVEIYPNPILDKLYINSSTQTENIKIYNSLGCLIYQGNENIIPIASFEKGMYFVFVKFNDNSYFTKQLIKE